MNKLSADKVQCVRRSNDPDLTHIGLPMNDLYNIIYLDARGRARSISIYDNLDFYDDLPQILAKHGCQHLHTQKCQHSSRETVLRDALAQLLDWEARRGGLEAPCWRNARKVLGRIKYRPPYVMAEFLDKLAKEAGEHLASKARGSDASSGLLCDPGN